jgi:hypothetical protein
LALKTNLPRTTTDNRILDKTNKAEQDTLKDNLYSNNKKIFLTTMISNDNNARIQILQEGLIREWLRLLEATQNKVTVMGKDHMYSPSISKISMSHKNWVKKTS